MIFGLGFVLVGLIVEVLCACVYVLVWGMCWVYIRVCECVVWCECVLSECERVLGICVGWVGVYVCVSMCKCVVCGFECMLGVVVYTCWAYVGVRERDR